MVSADITTQATNVYLSSDQISSLPNVFLTNLLNKEFVLGHVKRRLNAPTMMIPILVLLIGAVVTGVFALVGVWIVTLVLAALFIVGAIFAYRSYVREKRLDEQGHLLKATISNVTGRERAQALTTIERILGVISFLMDLFSDSSYNERRAARGPGAYQPEDFYEVSIEYRVTTPSGSQISAVVKQNRPDLRGSLPDPSDVLLLLYVDDGLYKVM